MITDITISNKEDIALDLNSIGLPDTYLYSDTDEKDYIFTQGSFDFSFNDCIKNFTNEGLTLVNEDNDTLFIPIEAYLLVKDFLIPFI